MSTIDQIKLLKANWRWIVVAIIIMSQMPQIIYYGVKILNGGEHPADRIRSQLTQMYQELNHLPGSVVLKEGSFVRENGGDVYGDFSTDLNIEEVLAYYDKELKSKGWVFKEFDIVEEWGEDTGGRSARYTKGDYQAFIGYNENKIKHGTKFTVCVKFYRW